VAQRRGGVMLSPENKVLGACWSNNIKGSLLWGFKEPSVEARH